MVEVGIAWVLGDSAKNDNESLKYLLVQWGQRLSSGDDYSHCT